MARNNDPPTASKGRRFWRASDWLDGKLMPVLGPPPLGPYGDAASQDPLDATCPLCSAPMREHEVERDGEHSYLHCPGNYGQVQETGRH